ncbi:Hypothetical protein HDN1F_24240 [gamma proteobacterium HdN1]|nr:Hypothetical protein HDN1F_24240 [gamma proteobacterium HdN1]
MNPERQKKIKMRYWRALVRAFLLVLLCTPKLLCAQENVTLQLRWYHQFQFAGYYAAIHKGFYHEAGLNVTLKEGSTTINTTTEVVSGRADFGIGLSNLIVDYLEGQPVVILAPIFQHSANRLLLYGNNRRMSDLLHKGKIALMEDNMDVELKALLLSEGAQLEDIHFLPDKEHLQDLISGHADAIYAYASNEPYEMEMRHIPYTVLTPSSYSMDLYGDTLFTTKNTEQSRPALVAAFRAASLRGWQYAFDHQEEIIQLILRDYNTQHKTHDQLVFEADTLRKLTNPDVIMIGTNNRARWAQTAAVFSHFGLIPKKSFDLDNFFYQGIHDPDYSWLQRFLGITMGLLVLVAGITIYIFHVNRRLALTLSRLSVSEERHRLLFQNAASAAIVWRDQGIITDWNRQAEKVFGWAREDVLGKSFMDFLLPKEDAEALDQLLRKFAGQRVPERRVNSNLTRDGRVITCEWFNSELPRASGKGREVVSMGVDITARIQLEEEIRELAFIDPLTHLPNRRILQSRLDHELAILRRKGGHGVLMFLDLDNFKPLNDTYGHAAGDHLLVQVATRLKECVRDTDTLVRLGGDEFIVLAGRLDHDIRTARKQATILANKLLKRISEPYLLDSTDETSDIRHRCTVSIGVTLFDNSVSGDFALKQADTTMYSAKNSGRNCVEYSELTATTRVIASPAIHPRVPAAPTTSALQPDLKPTQHPDSNRPK